jgi:hypothetical protein
MRRWLTQLQTICFGHPRHRLHIGFCDPFGLVPISVALPPFNTHLYVVGQSGQGKSKFLQHLLVQLTATDWGCGVFDPHSDLATDLIAHLAAYPKRQPWLCQPTNWDRVIYLDPARTDYMVPCNILKNSSSTSYEIAENVVEAFRRVWPESLSEAPRFAQILRNAVLVLIANELTLLELEPLLTHKAFRMRMLQKVQDPLVASFFMHQFDQWGRREQPVFIAPVLNKVSAFLFKPQVRLMLGANENRLDFRSILDQGKVFILNLGGFRDEETQRLLGSLFLTSLEQAAFSRSKIQSAERRPFFCMIDEFPLFCARDQTSLARILSECRKYRLHLGLAHQTISQLPEARIQGALENAKLKVVFGTGRQTAEAIVKELFMPDPAAVKHEVSDREAQERTHPLFDPMLEQFERFIQTIQRLRHQQVLIKLPESEKAYEVRIPTVPPASIDMAQMAALQQALAKAVGRSYKALEEEIAHRMQVYGAPFHLSQAQPVYTRDKEFWEGG